MVHEDSKISLFLPADGRINPTEGHAVNKYWIGDAVPLSFGEIVND